MADRSPTLAAASDAPFWKRGVIYQVYPKSFRDSGRPGKGMDGVGDLQGIIQKLPYLQSLGIAGLWLSPIFRSPMRDNGYDVSDYQNVDPLFGALEDAEELFKEAGKRGIRVILDIALNHSSTDHPWFQDALRHGPKRDWYIWREQPDPARPPNNWRSIFGGPAWTRPAGDAEAYLHLFDRSQADLNWENRAVRAAIYEAMRFWLAKGAGGFRLDVVTVISKPEGLPDAPDHRHGPFYSMLADGPQLHAYLREMRREVFSQFDCVAIGEAPGVDPERAAQLVDPADPMLDLIYHFDFVSPKRDGAGRWDRAAFKRTFSDWDRGIGQRGWNTTVLSNHDLGRIVSRFGDDARFPRQSATALLTLQLLMRGTPFLYQGDELGLTNTRFTRMADLDDVWAKTTYRLKREAGASEEAAFAAAHAMTRDHARLPFPWDDSPGGGFTEGAQPWLPMHQDAARLNAARQSGDSGSTLAAAKRLIALRAGDPIWTAGEFEDVSPPNSDIFHFIRRLDGREAHVAINLDGQDAAFDAPNGRPVFYNYADAGPQGVLRPWEALVFSD